MNTAHASLLERSSLEGTYLPSTASWAQVEPGSFDVHYGSVLDGPLEIAFRNYNLGFHVDVTVEPQKSVFILVAHDQTRARWCGEPMDNCSIAASRTSVDVRTRGPSRFFRVTVDEALLALQFPSSPDAADLAANKRPGILARDGVNASRLRALIQRVLSRSGVAARTASGALIPALAEVVDGFGDHAVDASKCLRRRLSAVRSCEEYMRAHVDATVTLLDLSQVSGMRSRSLINAFQAVTGFTPMDYLKRLRLNGVRRALQRADRNQTRIIDVATAWGFWHMGHFASDYRAMFGESPSRTLLA
jgi:AraC family ethanolamine operon transcriptional activator